MKMRFPHSQGDVRVLQSSFRKYLAIEPTISPDALLQSANSQRRDIFRLFFETLTERKVDLEECKSYFTGEVPPPYQLDLEQAFAPFISAGAVAMETLSTSKEGPGKSTHTHTTHTTHHTHHTHHTHIHTAHTPHTHTTHIHTHHTHTHTHTPHTSHTHTTHHTHTHTVSLHVPFSTEEEISNSVGTQVRSIAP